VIWDQNESEITCVIADGDQGAAHVHSDVAALADHFLNGGFAYYELRMAHRYTMEMDGDAVYVGIKGYGSRGTAHDRKNVVSALTKAFTFARKLPTQ
jgi:hypothetical protein